MTVQDAIARMRAEAKTWSDEATAIEQARPGLPPSCSAVKLRQCAKRLNDLCDDIEVEGAQVAREFTYLQSRFKNVARSHVFQL